MAEIDGGADAKRIASDAVEALTVAGRAPMTIPETDRAYLRTVAAEL